MSYVRVRYARHEGGTEHQSEIVVEGFGPNTVLGAVKDLADPGHVSPDGKSRVVDITIVPEGAPKWSDGKNVSSLSGSSRGDGSFPASIHLETKLNPADETVLQVVQRHISACDLSKRWWEEYLRDNPAVREMSVANAHAAGKFTFPRMEDLNQGDTEHGA